MVKPEGLSNYVVPQDVPADDADDADDADEAKYADDLRVNVEDRMQVDRPAAAEEDGVEGDDEEVDNEDELSNGSDVEADEIEVQDKALLDLRLEVVIPEGFRADVRPNAPQLKNSLINHLGMLYGVSLVIMSSVIINELNFHELFMMIISIFIYNVLQLRTSGTSVGASASSPSFT